MIRITKEVQQIIVNNNERYAMREELENAFVAMDTKTTKNAYSFKNIAKISPKLAELYSVLGS